MRIGPASRSAPSHASRSSQVIRGFFLGVVGVKLAASKPDASNRDDQSTAPAVESAVEYGGGTILRRTSRPSGSSHTPDIPSTVHGGSDGEMYRNSSPD